MKNCDKYRCTPNHCYNYRYQLTTMFKSTCMLVIVFFIFVFDGVSSSNVRLPNRKTRNDLMPMNYYYDANDASYIMQQLDDWMENLE